MACGDLLKALQVIGNVPEEVVVLANGIIFGYGDYD